MLEAFDPEHEIRAHRDHFEPGAPDTRWLATIAEWEPKPVVVCGDGRILRNPTERRVLMSCGLTFVYLEKGWTSAKWDDFAWRFVKVWPNIVRNASKTREPSVFAVNFSSLKVQKWEF